MKTVAAKIVISVLTFISIMAWCAVATSDGSGGRIVAGEVAQEGEVPWQLSVKGLFGTHYCGGVIISADFFITTARCTFWESMANLRIGCGSNEVSRPLFTKRVSSIVLHPGYNVSSTGYTAHNIAILRVDTPFELSSLVAALLLPEAGVETPEGTLAIISGWGSTKYGGQLTEELMRTEVPVVAQLQCEAAYGIEEGALCVGQGADGKGACSGDIGGSVVVGGKLSGVLTNGYACSEPNFPRVPDLCTDIAFYRDWIREVTGL